MIRSIPSLPSVSARFGGSATQVTPVKEIHTGWMGDSGDSVQVIRSQAELDALWERSFRDVPKPTVDFDQQAVFFVTATIPQSNYDVKLDSAEVKNNRWTLKMRLESLGGFGLTAFSTAAYLGIFDKPASSTETPQPELVLRRR